MTRRGALLALHLPSDRATQWFVRAANSIERMTREELEAAYRAGRLEGDTAAWTRGMEEWVPLQRLMAGWEVTASGPGHADQREGDLEEEPTRPGKEPTTGVALRARVDDLSASPLPSATAQQLLSRPLAASSRPPPPPSRRATRRVQPITEPSLPRASASRARMDSAPPLDELMQRSTASSLRPVENSMTSSAAMDREELAIPIAMPTPASAWRARAMIGATLLGFALFAALARHVASPAAQRSTRSEERSPAANASTPGIASSRSEDHRAPSAESLAAGQRAPSAAGREDSAARLVVPEAANTSQAVSRAALDANARAVTSAPSDAVNLRDPAATRSKLARRTASRNQHVRKQTSKKSRWRLPRAKGSRASRARSRPLATTSTQD